MSTPGWEWALPPLIGAAPLYRGRKALLRLLAGVAPGLFWLVLFVATGDRRLYFCYSMQFAAQLACLWAGRGLGASVAGGTVVIAAFLAIRIGQGAAASVLLVEFAVAAVVIAASILLHGTGPQSAVRRNLVAVLASLLAFAGLAFQC